MLSSQTRVLFPHMVLWDPRAKTSKMAPKSQLHGWLLSTSLHACMAQGQPRQDPALNGGSWPIAEGCTRTLSACGEIITPLAGMLNWEKNFSLKVPTALQCWKKSLWGSDPFWCFSKPVLQSSRYIYIGGGLLSTVTTPQEPGTTNQLLRFDAVLEHISMSVDGSTPQ